MLRIAGAVMAMACLLVSSMVTGAPPGRSEAEPTRRSWLVIAPHPDDEALTAGGVLVRAVEAGESVAVVVVTNGDYDCVHDGLRRQQESVVALAALGVPEDRIVFLGFPDGGLGKLGRLPLGSRRLERGRCVIGGTTYGARGFGGHDYHRTRFGEAAPYTRAAAVSDLAAVIAEVRPSDVVVTHGADTHPDHAATYALFRSALERLAEPPRVHRALVHNGDCWPIGDGAGPPCPPGGVAVSVPTPPLSGRLFGYQARERWPVPMSCRTTSLDANPKVRAIAAYVSQTRGDPQSYLFSFARADELFFPETYRREPRREGRRDHGRDAGRWTVAMTSEAATAPGVFRLVAERPATVPARIGAIWGPYRLDIDADRGQATLTRTSGTHAASVLQEWPLAHDLWSARTPEVFELEFASRPHEGVVTEVTLRVRDEIVGVAVDVR